MAILSLSPLPAQSQISGYEKRLRRRACLREIYVNKRGLYDHDQQAIPNAIYMDVDGIELGKSNSVTITMKLPLTGFPVVGNSRYTGTEEQPNTKAGTIYRNNWGKAVRVETFGVRKLDQEPYGLYKTHINDLGDWAAQYEGLEVRMALCEVFAYNLWFGDTSANCQPAINPHVFVANTALANQPAYHNTLTTYTNRIVTALLAAGGGSLAGTNAQSASFRMFTNLGLWALNNKIWPMTIGGKDAYVLVVSPLFASIYADPTWSNAGGSSAPTGSQWIQFTNLNKEVQDWYGIHGVFHHSIGCDIYIVVDTKHPTVLPAGTGEPYSLSFYYVWPGDLDLRHLNNPNIRDVNILLGRGAVQNWTPEKMHFIKQDDNYYKVMGHGIAGVRGIQQVLFDQQNPGNSTLEYYGSGLVLTSRPTNYV